MAGKRSRQPGGRSLLTDPKRKLHGVGQGQALIEFALVVILLFMLLFGIIDFSRLFFAYATMSNGVREGARYGIVHPPYPPDYPEATAIQEVTDAAQKMMVVIGGEATIRVNYLDIPGGGYPRCGHHCRIEVIATSDFPVWTPFIPNVQIEARATMHFE